MATENAQHAEDRPAPCQACGRPSALWRHVNGSRIDRCPDCGHGFVWPRPSRIRLNQLYMSLDLSEAAADHAWHRRHESGRPEPDMVAEHLAKLGKTGGSMLDVGAGEGRFCRTFLSRGFAVTPFEINAGLAARLERETGQTVVTEPFELWAPEHLQRYDVIVISQVLEHVVDCSRWLAAARGLLAPNGVLFVSVPSFESLLVRIIGAAEGNINPPTHLNFFTRQSLSRMAVDSGLTLIHQHTPNVLPPLAAMDAAAEALSPLPRPLGWAAGLFAWAGLGLTAPLGMGRFVHCYFTAAAGTSEGDPAS